MVLSSSCWCVVRRLRAVLHNGWLATDMCRVGTFVQHAGMDGLSSMLPTSDAMLDGKRQTIGLGSGAVLQGHYWALKSASASETVSVGGGHETIMLIRYDQMARKAGDRINPLNKCSGPWWWSVDHGVGYAGQHIRSNRRNWPGHKMRSQIRLLLVYCERDAKDLSDS